MASALTHPSRSNSTTGFGAPEEAIIGTLGLGDGHKKFGCSIGAVEEWIASLP
jgi:hypothetical protein